MEYEFLYRLSICFLLSFLIGIERQYRRKIIGLRTTILVSVGCFLFVTFSFSIGASDVSRIASGVVTGIGFLGAGVILKDGKKVTGLTTAATLWCVAALGVLCAGGAISEAIVGGILILFSNIILRYVNKLIDNLNKEMNKYNIFLLNIKCHKRNAKNLKKELQEFINKNNIQITKRHLTKEFNEINFNYEFKILENKKEELDNFINNLEELKIDNFELSKVIDSKTEEFDI